MHFLKTSGDRLDDVHRIVGTKGLGKDIGDTCKLEDCTNRATSDNASTRSSRLQEHLTSAIDAEDLVRKRLFRRKRNSEHILLRIVDALADRDRHFLGLAHANTNATVAIADDDQCSKSEATTALDYLGYTIDIDNTFFELRNVCLVFLFTSHLPLPSLRTSGLLHGHRRQQPGCDHDRGCHRDRRPLR